MPHHIYRSFKMAFALNAVVVAFVFVGCAPKPQTLEIASNLPMPSREALAKISLLPSPYNTGNASNGRSLFSECAQCHTLERNGSETKGPNLHGVFGRRAAVNERYPYSEALRNSNIVWDVRHLDHWIFNPHEALPGTTMAYIGVRNDAKRYDILAYLIASTSDGELEKH